MRAASRMHAPAAAPDAAAPLLTPAVWAEAQVLAVRPSSPLVPSPAQIPSPRVLLSAPGEGASPWPRQAARRVRRVRARVRWHGVRRARRSLVLTAVVAAAAWALVALVLAMISLVASVVTAVVAAVMWVYAHLVTILAVVVGLPLLAALFLGGGSKCSGLHCGGCKG